MRFQPAQHAGYLCLALAASLLALSSFARGQQVADPATPVAAPVPSVGSDYVLRVNDLVAISVFGEPELSTQDRLAGDGTIMMPLAGRISLRGRTAQSAAEAIRAALAADYLVNPQVSVSVVEFSKQFYTVLGQVASAGTYALPASGRLPILQAIGQAGGFTRLANPSKVEVKRRVGAREEVFKLDLRRLSREAGTGFDVLPGDVLTVPESIF